MIELFKLEENNVDISLRFIYMLFIFHITMAGIRIWSLKVAIIHIYIYIYI